MPPKKSSGRSSSAKKSASRGSSIKKRKAMAFQEGDGVLAKWPGTTLFFKAKVTYVRDEDDEYDVQYEDGTVFTIKAKDVKKTIKTPNRSQSRGRSPGRSRKPQSPSTPPRTPSTSSRQSRSTVRAKAAARTATPVRQSARIAAKVELSGDEEERTRAAAIAKRYSPRRGFKAAVFEFFSNLSFEWLTALIFTVLPPFILISCHKLCRPSSCKPALPFAKLPKTFDAYWDLQSFLFVLAFFLVGKLLHFLPVGTVVKAPSRHDVRMNGFVVLLLMLAAIPGLIYKNVPLTFVTDKYFYLMTSGFFLAFLMSLSARLKAHIAPGGRTNVNPRGDTGNIIVDICQGRELNPHIGGSEGKLEVFRFSMTGLAMLNVVMVLNSIMSKGGVVNPVVVLASSFQVMYALDALFFEEYFFLSHDSMNQGLGLHLLSGYITFPFAPTLITQYLIDRSPVMKWYYLVAIAALNAIGYLMFRASETQRCEFAKDPNSPNVRHLKTITAVGGKKLLVSGWFGIVRHPNYLGEILMEWSWVLPAACTIGKTDLIVYYLPVMTTLVLILRCTQQNAKNKKKYGMAWNTYCEKVTGNFIPKVF